MLAWGWSLLMLCAVAVLGVQGDALGLSVPNNLLIGLVFSAAIVLPLLWDKASGLFGGIGASGLARAGLALLLPLVCGLAGTSAGVDRFMIA